MNRIILSTALCLVGHAAMAGGSGHEPGPTPTASPTYNTAAAGAAALSRSAARSNATATGGAARATGGRASAATGPVTVNNSTGGGGYGGGYSGTHYTTPDAIAPSLSTANECALPRTFGVSAILAGISGGWGTETDSCKRERLARALERLGDAGGAREALCLEDDMRRAAYSSGHPCAKDAHGWDTGRR